MAEEKSAEEKPTVYTGYCVKCREKGREMKNTKVVTMKGRGGKRRAVKGNCVVCDCGMYRILGKA